jgi:hypothetical protein
MRQLQGVVKGRCEHIHHCPLCDRLKRIVRANANNLRLNLYGLARPNGWIVWPKEILYDVLVPLFKIEEAASAFHVRRTQSMTEDEADAYAAAHLLAEPWRPEGAPEADRFRPELTLVMGGLAPRGPGGR